MTFWIVLLVLGVGVAVIEYRTSQTHGIRGTYFGDLSQKLMVLAILVALFGLAGVLYHLGTA